MLGVEGSGEPRGVCDRARGIRAPRAKIGRTAVRIWKKASGRSAGDAADGDAPTALEPEPEPELPDCPVFQPAGGLFSLGFGFSFPAFSPGGQE